VCTSGMKGESCPDCYATVVGMWLAVAFASNLLVGGYTESEQRFI